MAHPIKFIHYDFAELKPKISTHLFEKKRWGLGGVGAPTMHKLP